MTSASATQHADHGPQLAQIYRLLALAMEYPTPPWLSPEQWNALATIFKDIDAGQMAPRFPDYPETAQQREALQVEYTRLFINAVPHVIAPLYGSVYLDDDGMLYGPSAERVKAFYHQAEWTLKGAYDIPDSLDAQLKFLALLMEEEKEDEADRFLEQCFRPWFRLFFERVNTEAQHPYYRVLVLLINFFTQEEENDGI